MARADAVLKAVELIHDAPLTPDGWTCTLPAIASALCSEHAVALVQNAVNYSAELVTGFELTPKHLAAFATAASARTLHWTRHLRQAAPGVPQQSSSMYSDAVFRRSAFYNEAIRPTGAFYGMALSPLRTGTHHFYVTVGRRLGREDYDAEDLSVMRMLAPHIATAQRIGDRLAAADLRLTCADAAFDCLATGLILVDAAAQVLFANGVADAILSRGDCLRSNKAGLHVVDHRVTRTLRRLIAGCAQVALGDEAAGGVVEITRRGRAPLRVTVARFRGESAQLEVSWLLPARPVAILMITDPGPEQFLHGEELRCRFSLTTAEADVALEILKGDGRAAAAARLGIKQSTVHTHLVHIFEKTGVRRQAELVHLLLRGGKTNSN